MFFPTHDLWPGTSARVAETEQAWRGHLALRSLPTMLGVA